MKMDETLLGLNYWAWLGFLFLLLAGICSALAAKTTTQTIFNNGTTKILSGTKGQIDNATKILSHPVTDLYSFLVKEHKLISDELLGELSLFGGILNAIKVKENGKNNIKGGEGVTISQLQSTNQRILGKISNLNNKFYPSLNTLKLLINNLDKESISKPFNDYKESFEIALKNKDLFYTEEIEYKRYSEKIKETKELYSDLIEKVNVLRQNVFE